MIEWIILIWVIIRVMFITMLIFCPDSYLKKMFSNTSVSTRRLGFGIDLVLYGLIVYYMWGVVGL